mmetsp:Transcript_23797/g.35518  ORF Transcript_23797/g.35518 Transcript_23797/m.35518 type:complete len:106 (+) Transcript_23797:22-339(+)
MASNPQTQLYCRHSMVEDVDSSDLSQASHSSFPEKGCSESPLYLDEEEAHVTKFTDKLDDGFGEKSEHEFESASVGSWIADMAEVFSSTLPSDAGNPFQDKDDLI